MPKVRVSFCSSLNSVCNGPHQIGVIRYYEVSYGQFSIQYVSTIKLQSLLISSVRGLKLVSISQELMINLARLFYLKH